MTNFPWVLPTNSALLLIPQMHAPDKCGSIYSFSAFCCISHITVNICKTASAFFNTISSNCKTWSIACKSVPLAPQKQVFVGIKESVSSRGKVLAPLNKTVSDFVMFSVWQLTLQVFSNAKIKNSDLSDTTYKGSRWHTTIFTQSFESYS